MILFPYRPPKKGKDRSDAHQAALANLTAIGQQFIAVPCIEQFSYHDIVMELMPREEGDDLTIIEQDMLPTWQALYSLEACPHKICAVAYMLRAESTPNGYSYLAHRDKYGIPVPEGTEWAVSWGLGCTRFKGPIEVPPHFPIPWNVLDTSLCEWLGSAHVHWPIIPQVREGGHNYG